MSWRDQPNASHYSARYAEHKRAAERARDAAAGPRTCNRCATVCKTGSIFCDVHAIAYATLLARADVTPDQLSGFCSRTHWPEPVRKKV